MFFGGPFTPPGHERSSSPRLSISSGFECTQHTPAPTPMPTQHYSPSGVARSQRPPSLLPLPCTQPRDDLRPPGLSPYLLPSLGWASGIQLLPVLEQGGGVPRAACLPGLSSLLINLSYSRVGIPGSEGKSKAGFQSSFRLVAPALRKLGPGLLPPASAAPPHPSRIPGRPP